MLSANNRKRLSFHEWMSNPDPRARLLKDLERQVRKLPNGLLLRLIKDAEEFNAWNMSKKNARQRGRLTQYQSWKKKAEKAYFGED